MNATRGLRLTQQEIAAIKRIVAEHFGPEVEVRLFGSLTRADIREGDLDLHACVLGALPSRETEYRALDAIIRAMDDLRVDLWTGSAETPTDRSGETALRTGTRL